MLSFCGSGADFFCLTKARFTRGKEGRGADLSTVLQIGLGLAYWTKCKEIKVEGPKMVYSKKSKVERARNN